MTSNNNKSKLQLSETEDILRVQGVHAKGFGTIPKLVMKDTRLSIQAKAIYAYFRSYAGAGDTAFPSVRLIMSDLGIKDVHTFLKHRKMLEDCGYITVEQEVQSNGKFGRNIYTLIDNPIPIAKISHTTTVCEKTRIGKNPNREISHTNNNSLLKNNSNNKNNQSVSQSVLLEEPEKKEPDGQTDEVHTLFEQAQVELFENEELKEHIKEAITQAYTQAATRNIIQRIRLEHIDRALAKFREAQEQQNIKNPKLYFFKCLISAITEHGLSATAWTS